MGGRKRGRRQRWVGVEDEGDNCGGETERGGWGGRERDMCWEREEGDEDERKSDGEVKLLKCHATWGCILGYGKRVSMNNYSFR